MWRLILKIQKRNASAIITSLNFPTIIFAPIEGPLSE